MVVTWNGPVRERKTHFSSKQHPWVHRYEQSQGIFTAHNTLPVCLCFAGIAENAGKEDVASHAAATSSAQR
jgi:hypothetical protein